MTKRRSRGEGGLHWDTNRERWVATVTTGYDARGKRMVKQRSAKTKTDAKDKLKELLRDLDDGLPIADEGYTVQDAVTAWLTYGLSGKDPQTIANYRHLADGHVTPNPNLGRRKLRELSAEDVGKWLARARHLGQHPDHAAAALHPEPLGPPRPSTRQGEAQRRHALRDLRPPRPTHPRGGSQPGTDPISTHSWRIDQRVRTSSVKPLFSAGGRLLEPHTPLPLPAPPESRTPPVASRQHQNRA
jgi:hypothetical protein